MHYCGNSTVIIILISFVVCLIFNYFLSGWATTVIFRSNKKNSEFLLSGKCVCDYCGSKIPNIYTLPVLGRKLLHGKTKCCNKEILYYPKYEINYIIAETIIFFCA